MEIQLHWEFGNSCRIRKKTIDKVCRQIMTAKAMSDLRSTHVKYLIGVKKQEARK